MKFSFQQCLIRFGKLFFFTFLFFVFECTSFHVIFFVHIFSYSYNIMSAEEHGERLLDDDVGYSW